MLALFTMNTGKRLSPITVLALGGNALGKSPSGEKSDLQSFPELRPAASTIANYADRHFVITHGNGPQIGQLAQCRIDGLEQGLDALGAETEGLLGYHLEQELANHFGPDQELATLLTRVEVDADDPAFSNPEKPIGIWLTQEQKHSLAARYDWAFMEKDHMYRRLVPSPRPLRILQTGVIKTLIANNVTIICTGGGGIPVIRGEKGKMQGTDAVIDKDFSSALLATELDADMLVLATDVDGVYRNWASPEQEKIHTLSPHQSAQLELPAGSMGPKVQAACEFVSATGKPAVIGALSDLAGLLQQKAGTLICQ